MDKELDMIRKTKFLITPLLLILMEQVIKIYIFNNLMKKEFNLAGNILIFKPYINIKYSWINSLGNLGIGLLAHIIFNLVLILITFLIYFFVKEKYGMGRYGYCLFSFLSAGEICSLLDKIAWGGSLDYILLKGFFIFDLKDVYLSSFEVMAVLGIILNYRIWRNITGRAIGKDFMAYIKDKLNRSRNQ
jgi:signal peptidase II